MRTIQNSRKIKFLDITPTSSSIPVGTVSCFAGVSAPNGYLFCNAAAVSRTTFASLFAVIGTTFGVGDNATTFNVPDCRSRTIVGVGTGVYTNSGLAHSINNPLRNRVLSERGGAEYSSGLICSTSNPDSDDPRDCALTVASTDFYRSNNFNQFMAENVGGGNIQPYITFNYIIKF